MKVFRSFVVALSIFLTANFAEAVIMSCTIEDSNDIYKFSLDENNSCSLISIPQPKQDWELRESPKCEANSTEVKINTNYKTEREELKYYTKTKVIIDRSNGILSGEITNGEIKKAVKKRALKIGEDITNYQKAVGISPEPIGKGLIGKCKKIIITGDKF